MRFRNRERQLVPFTRDAVRSVINNVMVYSGYVLRHKGRHVDISVDIGDGDVVEAIAQHTNAIIGQHAPLISHELAARIIQVRRKSIRRHGKLERRVFPLYPTARCANCGGRLRGVTVLDQSMYIHEGKVCIRRAGVWDATALEQRTLKQLRGLRLSASQRVELKRRIEDKLRNVPEHAETLATIRNLEAKQERLKVLYIEGDLDKAQYDQQKRATHAAIEDLQVRLGPRTLSLDVVFAQMDSISDILEHGSPQQQRRAVAAIFVEIHFDFRGKIVKMNPHEWMRAVFQDFCCAPETPGAVRT